MHVIGDLGRPAPVTSQFVGAAADHFAVQHGQQRGMIRAGLAAYPAGLLIGRGRAHAEEAQVKVVRDILACSSRTAAKSSGRATRISIVVPSVSRA